MKRLVLILVIVSFFFSSAYFSLKFAIIHAAKRQLENVFSESNITIKECELKPTHLIRFSDISICKEGIYRVTAKEAEVQYNISSLLHGTILKVCLKGAFIKIALPKSNISEFRRHLNLNSKRTLLIKKVELSNLHLNISANDLEMKAGLSSQLRLDEQLIDSLYFNIDFLNTRLFKIENAFLKSGQNLPSGILYINLIKYNNLEIREVRSKAKLEDKTLFLEPLSAQLLGGQAEGGLNLRICTSNEYLVNINFLNLNINTFINDFNLGEKLQMSGFLNGNIMLNGNLSGISLIKGDFSTLEPGGNLAITDIKMLKNIANSSKQPLEIIVESFKNYRYNVGTITLLLDNGNLILRISLDGKTGKRDLTATIYGFKSFLKADMPFLDINN